MEEFNFKNFKVNALEQLKEGKSIFGKGYLYAVGGASVECRPWKQDGCSHGCGRALGRQPPQRLHEQAGLEFRGELSICTPRDRNTTFDPVMVKKRERILADCLTDRIIELYDVGTSTREISRLMEEQFGNRISP